MSHIAYVLPSHNRPVDLIQNIRTAWNLRSHKHDIIFAVSCDDDDESSANAMQMISSQWPDAPIQLYVNPTPDDIGSLWNNPLKHLPEADIATFMADRIFPITLNWDDVLDNCVKRFPNRVMWWSSPQGHAQILPVMGKDVLDVWPDRAPFPTEFPFWYTDCWVEEIDCYIHGFPPLSMPAYFVYDRKETKRLRDVPFWASYYIALRPKRLAIARDMARTFGIKWVDRPEVTTEWERQDKWRTDHALEYEQRFGDPTPPTEGYLRIKARAEEDMGRL